MAVWQTWSNWLTMTAGLMAVSVRVKDQSPKMITHPFTAKKKSGTNAAVNEKRYDIA